MNKKYGHFSLLLLLFVTMIVPFGLLLLNASQSPLVINIETIEINTSQTPTNVVINEVLFDDSLSGDKGEYVELYNPTQNDIDITNWTITDLDPAHTTEGVFRFPNNSTIRSRGFIVIFQEIVGGQLINPDDVQANGLVQIFETRTGGDTDDPRVADLVRVSGNFDLQLANSGDELYLRNKDGILVDSMSFGPSPVTINIAIENRLLLNDASGTWNGSSLERVWNSYSWARDGYGQAIKMTPTPGAITGETPSYEGEDPWGSDLPTNIVINEVFFGPVQTATYTDGAFGSVTWQFNQFIEIYNPTDRNINVTGWTIEDDDGIQWEFIQGKHADELGDSDMLIIWPDRNDDQPNSTYMDPDDNYSPWWQFWNNVDKMETWYSGDDFRWAYDVDGDDTMPPDYGKMYELWPKSGSPSADFTLDQSDYVILRDENGTVVDVVCWGSDGYTNLPSDAKAAVDQYENAGTNHDIGSDESLERIWQEALPVNAFLYGPGTYHLPTPGKVVGDVPDEIEQSSATWEHGAGSWQEGGCGLGIGLQYTAAASKVIAERWSSNPKDHLVSGNLTLSGVVFWRVTSNVTLNPLSVKICYGDPWFMNESTFKLYVWNHQTSQWDDISLTQNTVEKSIISTPIMLDHSISEVLWFGVFGESTGFWESIPGFELAFLSIGLLCLVLAWLRWKAKEFNFSTP